MREFLQDLLRRRTGSYRVLVYEEDSRENPREYEVRPGRLRWLLAGSLLLIVLASGAAFTFTPLGDWIRGRDVESLRARAQSQARRLAVLADSMELQRRYARSLGAMVTGTVDSLAAPGDDGSGQGAGPVTGAAESPTGSGVGVRAAFGGGGFTGSLDEASSPRAVPWPVQPPASGFISRGFDAELGHFAVDVATEEGSEVRSIARGFVVLADWTQEGGLAVAVQHPGGYLSIYKHNSRILKQVGDPVDRREPIAVSGNTGHVTTGPHVHFELWRNGLAQNPHRYVVGW